VSCGHESPGWQMAGAHPVVRFPGDAQRHVVERVPMTVYGSRGDMRSHRVAS
jgi:hypothetical protein